MATTATCQQKWSRSGAILDERIGSMPAATRAFVLLLAGAGFSLSAIGTFVTTCRHRSDRRRRPWRDPRRDSCPLRHRLAYLHCVRDHCSGRYRSLRTCRCRCVFRLDHGCRRPRLILVQTGCCRCPCARRRDGYLCRLHLCCCHAACCWQWASSFLGWGVKLPTIEKQSLRVPSALGEIWGLSPARRAPGVPDLHDDRAFEVGAPLRRGIRGAR